MIRANRQQAFFNVMLRDFGVEDVRVQEIVSLDPDMLACLPYDAERPTPISPISADGNLFSRPVYGLIFLFKWREEDPDKQEPSCPEGIWFANQVSFD